MDLLDRDIEALLATACDDQGRPLTFGMDDVVRRGRRRTRIRRIGGAAATTVAAGALVTGAVVWASSTGAEWTDAPVAGQETAVASLPVIRDNRWERLGDDVWFRIAEGQPGQNGLDVAGVHAIVTDRPHEYDGKGPSAGRAVEQRDRDRGWVSPMAYAGREQVRQFAMLRGDVRSAVFTTTGEGDTVRSKATIYRLASLPGWVLAVGESQPRSSDDGKVQRTSFDAYDADGKPVLHCVGPSSGPSCTR